MPSGVLNQRGVPLAYIDEADGERSGAAPRAGQQPRRAPGRLAPAQGPRPRNARLPRGRARRQYAGKLRGPVPLPRSPRLARLPTANRAPRLRPRRPYATFTRTSGRAPRPLDAGPRGDRREALRQQLQVGEERAPGYCSQGPLGQERPAGPPRAAASCPSAALTIPSHMAGRHGGESEQVGRPGPRATGCPNRKARSGRGGQAWRRASAPAGAVRERSPARGSEAERSQHEGAHAPPPGPPMASIPTKRREGEVPAGDPRRPSG